MGKETKENTGRLQKEAKSVLQLLSERNWIMAMLP